DWTVKRAGTGHGLSVWFDAALVPGIGFSNAPGEPELIYGTAFFPWSTPVSLLPGDTVSVMLRADLIGQDYLWTWETRVLAQGRSQHPKVHFKQSTFLGAPISPNTLSRRAAHYLPALNHAGKIANFVLTRMDGQTPLGEIAGRLAAEFPDRFANW